MRFGDAELKGLKGDIASRIRAEWSLGKSRKNCGLRGTVTRFPEGLQDDDSPSSIEIARGAESRFTS
jgi:hypothetical protein